MDYRNTPHNSRSLSCPHLEAHRCPSESFPQGGSHTGVLQTGCTLVTVVLPDANLKIYLDATPECRAIRRMKEREESGIKKSFEDTLEEIKVRDFKDSTRKIGPLKIADDAILIDTSNMSIDEVVEAITKLIK